MKILIIGSEGFIGKNLWSHFTKDAKYSVFRADIVDIKEDDYFRIKEDEEDFKLLFKQEFKVCINASGSGSVAFSNTNPQRDYKLNTENVLLILEAIRSIRPSCKFINFSSAAVYGNSKTIPITEDQELNPVSPYGKHKLMSEVICKDFYEKYKIETLSLRVFSVYGPGLKKQLFWDIYQKAIAGKEIVLEGSGNETRDFIFIDDLCEAVDKLLLFHEFKGGVVNVSSGQSTTIKKAAELMVSNLFKEGKVTFTNNTRVGDPIHYLGDISALKKIGFDPKCSIEKGIKKYATWLQEKR
jgi:UDP-glucose 4-epimerase